MRLLLVALICFPVFLWGNDQVISSCSVTPEIYVGYDMPKSFSLSNSLVRRSSSLHRAKGDLILVEGRILDIDCVPVANALVRIWQLNSAGLDQRDSEEMLSNDGKNSKKILRMHDSNFIETGTSSTDNLGYYRFLTVMPGAKSGHVPNINFFVSHKDFVDFTTTMFFNDVHAINKKDNKTINYKDEELLQKYPKNLIDLLVARKIGVEQGARIYRFDITLGGSHAYKKY